MFASILTTVLYAISAVCGHRSARLIGGTEANFWRILCAAVFLGTYSYTVGHGLNGAGFPMLLLSGVVGIGFGDVAYFQALVRLGPHLSLLLVQCLTAPFGALIEWLWLEQKLTLWQMASGAVVLAGVGIALAPGQQVKLTRRELTTGVLWGLFAAVGNAGGAVLSRKAYLVLRANGEHIDGINAAFQRVVGGLVLAGIVLLIVKRREFRIQSRAPHQLVIEVAKRKWRGVWHWILLNSLAGQTLGVSCQQWALETTPSGVVLPIIAMSPIVVIPIAFVMEGERPTRHSLIGGAIAVAGVIALTLAR